MATTVKHILIVILLAAMAAGCSPNQERMAQYQAQQEQAKADQAQALASAEQSKAAQALAAAQVERERTAQERERTAQQENPYTLAVIVGMYGFMFLAFLSVMFVTVITGRRQEQPKQVVYLIRAPQPRDGLTLRPIHAPNSSPVIYNGLQVVGPTSQYNWENITFDQVEE